MSYLLSLCKLIVGWTYLISFISGCNFVRQPQRKGGKRVKISPTANFKFPENIQIGDDSFVNHLCCIWASPKGRISIGKDVLLGPYTSIISSNHGISSDQLIRLQEGVDAPITIGNDVWIGAHVVVTAGTTIGDGCVVGAGAVVTKDLPPMSICVGVPARVIGYRQPHTPSFDIGIRLSEVFSEADAAGRPLSAVGDSSLPEVSVQDGRK
jgi:maltose O-acetyltransferase